VTRGAVWLFVTIDDRRNLALLRGDGARDTVEALGLADRYSRLGHGFVVDLDRVADVVAYAQFKHELAVVSNRRPPETAATA
jgi:hypothetical protein